MAEATTTSVRTPHRRLIDQVNSLKTSLARDHVWVTDMSRAGSLETGIGADPGTDAVQSSERRPVDIVRLEGRIAGRELDLDPYPPSRFRFFLDGTQKTMPICRVGLVPVVAALSAVGVLYRDTSGQPALMGDLLRVNQTWIAPRGSGDEQLDAMIDEVERSGVTVHDPGAGGAAPGAGDYGRSLAHAFDLAGHIRSQQEREVLDLWRDTISPHHPDDWIAVDGRLRGNIPNAIGIVKDLQTQHLSGDEAIALFDLPKGFRTTAFRYASSSNGSGPDASEGRTMWYLRLWNATGMDARHSLVRIEAPNHVSTSDQIDEVSRWILAERLPRATEDPRWPTLLYPIYYLERILKRRLADITAGWPSA
ncbi:MAG: hypothetical protein H0V37_05430 [Chloroflexia bacterium]|nr:hypothetical protein [Chloroflexia bacterium]